MVGHDIRNPLQAITSDVYLAKSDLSPLPDSEGKKNALESLSEIEENVGYINKIVQDLQDYARPIRASTKETEVETMINDLLSKNRVPPEIKIKVEVERSTNTAVVDPDLLKRVIGNLVANAVQAMPEGGDLAIRAYAESGEIVFSVQDTGVGIPIEVQPKVFTPLFTTKSKGQGFGLAVVERIVETMRGTVSLKSEMGKGTTFVIRLPSNN